MSSPSAPSEPTSESLAEWPRIRPATEEDYAFIETLTGRLFLSYGSYDQYLRGWFIDSRVATEIAEIEQRPVGFFMLATYLDAPIPRGKGPLVAELLAIGVATDHQGRGVGGRLLDRALEITSDRGAGIREVRLSVAEGNARAQRLFSRRGFRFVDAYGVYPAGQRALMMRRST